ncbi:LuxR C-terminal-related transcriptional regulator [Nocardia sp. NRRL WC-3656]|uniref:LuxR C-terminal-related transcriptional regulator n=1 Tax=Nocardia sp. NRRL WC-3656 TaxID=1463824 RepID=UPI0004C348C7|nr:LuxR C-terminal-related transcriptional regulator [Nocardia sp. NRRL WC-3656]
MSEQDALLAAKLRVPGLRRGFVPRPRLVGRLDAALTHGLVLVCAPAGFGKTGLLAEWARSGRGTLAWVSLDAADNDPARFWRHVVAALDRARPGIVEQLSPLLGPPAPTSFEALVTALINEFDARSDGDEVRLVVDDYHLIDVRAVHAALTLLVEHLPTGLRLVLATRSDPPLPLARLRARGQMAELRAEELRFASDEAAALLRGATGGDVPDAAVTMLTTRTEGWAAGLQLAGLSLRTQANPTRFAAEFSGSHRYILDYLAGEVLEQLSEQVRGFLLETSVLERLSGELCDAVTGRADSQEMLEGIESAGLFLVPLDEVRGWWRYHHLFAGLLRAQLQHERPGHARALHRHAGAWCESHGLAEEAVHHALRAGDTTWAAGVIERYFDEIFRRGEQATVHRWLCELPSELIRSRPRLCLAQAWMALVGSDLDAAGPRLDAAERTSADPGEESFEPSVGRAASWLADVPAAIAVARARLACMHGDAEAAAAFAARALAELGEDNWMLESLTWWQLGMAEWLRGRLREAEQAFASSIAQWHAADERSLAVRGYYHLGQVQCAQGRLDAALGTYRRALEITAPRGVVTLATAGMGYVGVAEVAYQRGDLEAALRDVTEGIAHCRQLTYTQPLAAGLATLAWIRQAEGDPAGALEAIGEAERLTPGTTMADPFTSVPVQWARLHLAQGDLATAAHWTKERGLSAQDEPDCSREPDYLVLARLLIARDMPGPALALLEKMLATATRDHVRSIIEIQALRALALAARGADNTAVDILADALTLAYEQGYVRVFADEGAAMGVLLRRLIAARQEGHAAPDVPLRYLARVLHGLGRSRVVHDSGSSATTTVPGLVEQLTAREREVLGLLVAGRSNRRIADELVVSVETVKKHLTHIFGKLGAVNRTEAVDRARQLGLIR